MREILDISGRTVFVRSFSIALLLVVAPFAAVGFLGGWLEGGVGSAFGGAAAAFAFFAACAAFHVGIGTLLNFSTKPALVVWIQDNKLCFRTNFDYARFDLQGCRVRSGQLSECTAIRSLILPKGRCFLVKAASQPGRRKITLAVGLTPEARNAWAALFRMIHDKQEMEYEDDYTNSLSESST